HPGLTPATRPGAVVLVDEHDWTAALASAALAAAPLNAPILYADGNTLPAISAEALRAMNPRGSALLRGAQVIAIGTSAAPTTYRVHALGSPANHVPVSPANASAALAEQIERLVVHARGAPPRQVIVVAADGPPALSMPAAGLAAETGAPILAVAAAGI